MSDQFNAIKMSIDKSNQRALYNAMLQYMLDNHVCLTNAFEDMKKQFTDDLQNAFYDIKSHIIAIGLAENVLDIAKDMIGTPSHESEV
jgi:hypothetical protein